MPRNLDLTALRSFVAVSDTGGVTRAAAMLNLTQSAVSMQLKRLEESLDQALLDRSGRGIQLTVAGEQLLSYGRKILSLNDEVYSRMTHSMFEGVLVLGVPSDIVYPAIPPVLRLFAAEYPRMKVQLLSSYTVRLKQLFADRECHLILTTEDGCDAGGETMTEVPLLWYGARDGTVWQTRPLPLASQPKCQFRKGMLAALDRVGIPWDLAVDSDSARTTEATVSADLAVAAYLKGTSGQLAPVSHGGALPDLGTRKINLYCSDDNANPALADLAAMVRRSFHGPSLALTA